MSVFKLTFEECLIMNGMVCGKYTCKFNRIFGLALAFVLVGGVVLYFSLGSIAKTIAEKVGSDALGVGVHIGSIDIKALDKTVTVKNIKIENPEGFSKPYAMKVALIHIDAETLSGSLLKFNDVTVSGTELFLEVTQKGTNLGALKKNAKKSGRRTSASDTSMDDSSSEPPKVAIKKFEISKAIVHPTITLVKGDMKDITLPNIVLRNIGMLDGGGTDASKLVGKIWGVLSTKAIQAATGAGVLKNMSPSDALDKAKSGLKGLFGN